MEHPYASAPPRAKWSKAVASGFDAAALVAGEPLLRADDRVASAGSCFAANIVPHLERAGLHYVRQRFAPTNVPGMQDDNFSYAKFSAGYGNIYTARQALQLVRRARGTWCPITDRWHTAEGVIDPFRPGLKYPASDAFEFDLLTAQHLRETRAVFEAATVFVFTLGLTEAWEAIEDGAVYPGCPGTIKGEYDPAQHRFVNFTTSQIAADLSAFIAEAREINPALRFIVTVSPVPLVATATGEHVLTATIYSKSALRAAAGEVCASLPDVRYFPAYEIITGPQAPDDFFESDRRTPSERGVGEVMRVLFASSGLVADEAAPAEVRPVANLSALITQKECEEAMADV